METSEMSVLVAKGGFPPDLSRSCRTCFNNPGTIPIFSGEEPDYEGYTLRDRIMSFAYVEIVDGDGLPSTICKVCAIQINMAFKLKAQCEYADSFWRRYISTSEDEESDHHDEELGAEDPEGEDVSEDFPTEEAMKVPQGEDVPEDFETEEAMEEPQGENVPKDFQTEQAMEEPLGEDVSGDLQTEEAIEEPQGEIVAGALTAEESTKGLADVNDVARNFTAEEVLKGPGAETRALTIPLAVKKLTPIYILKNFTPGMTVGQPGAKLIVSNITTGQPIRQLNNMTTGQPIRQVRNMTTEQPVKQFRDILPKPVDKPVVVIVEKPKEIHSETEKVNNPSLILETLEKYSPQPSDKLLLEKVMKNIARRGRKDNRARRRGKSLLKSGLTGTISGNADKNVSVHPRRRSCRNENGKRRKGGRIIKKKIIILKPGEQPPPKDARADDVAYYYSNEKVAHCPELSACPLCPNGYRRKYGLMKHLWADHEPTGEYPCKHCGKVMPLEELLKLHEEDHTAEKPFCCIYCGACLRTAWLLKTHELKHKYPQRRRVCKDCGEQYLYEHVCPATNPNREKTHECDICGKKYLKASILSYHRNMFHVHLGYRCTTCSEQFRRKEQMDLHIAKVHLGERKVICTFQGCGRAFFTKKQLSGHQQSHVGKPCKCTQCDRAFRNKSTLAIHVRVHTGERPYTCEVCGSAFRVLSTLKNHMNTHTDALRSRSRKSAGKNPSEKQRTTDENKRAVEMLCSVSEEERPSESSESSLGYEIQGTESTLAAYL